jgi:hypothetical protein
MDVRRFAGGDEFRFLREAVPRQRRNCSFLLSKKTTNVDLISESAHSFRQLINSIHRFLPKSEANRAVRIGESNWRRVDCGVV